MLETDFKHETIIRKYNELKKIHPDFDERDLLEEVFKDLDEDFVEDNKNTYYCNICKSNHFYDSEKGREHLNKSQKSLEQYNQPEWKQSWEKTGEILEKQREKRQLVKQKKELKETEIDVWIDKGHEEEFEHELAKQDIKNIEFQKVDEDKDSIRYAVIFKAFSKIKLPKNNLWQINNVFESKTDFDASKCNWITIRGTHVCMNEGETQAQAIKNFIANKEKERTPREKEESKKKFYEGLKEEKVKKKKVIKKEPSEPKQPKKPTKKEKELSEREKGVQKLIEQTGYERERAESEHNKEHPKKESIKKEKDQEWKNYRVKRKQEAVNKRVDTLRHLSDNDPNIKSVLKELIMILMDIIAHKKKTLVPFAKYYERIKKAKNLKIEKRVRLIHEIKKLEREMNELQGIKGETKEEIVHNPKLTKKFEKLDKETHKQHQKMEYEEEKERAKHKFAKDTIKIHETENFIRKQQFDPSECEEGTYRTFNIGKGKKAVGCRVNGKFKVQTILEPKNKKDFKKVKMIRVGNLRDNESL